MAVPSGATAADGGRRFERVKIAKFGNGLIFWAASFSGITKIWQKSVSGITEIYGKMVIGITFFVLLADMLDFPSGKSCLCG